MLPVFDLILVILCLASFAFIGFYFRPKTGANSADYFLARKQMSVIPAAFSITVSFYSSSTMTIFLGQVAMFGFPTYVSILAAVISSVVANCFVLHRFYDAPYLSVFLFLEHRFSRSVRIINSCIFVAAGLVNLAVVGYTVAISAEVLAGIPFWVSALAAGALATAYSTLGGIRAVIWTDFCQALLMVLCLVMICFKGLTSLESFKQFTTLISTSDRAQMRFSQSSSERYNFPSCTSHHVISYLYIYCVSQQGVQRWKSVKSLADAKKTVVVSMLLSSILSLLTFASGLTLYAFYARCGSPEGPFPTSDKISLYFVLKELSSWPGAQGLYLAGILSGALSTMSSFLNSFAAVTLEDCVKIRFKSLNEKLELTVSKALTAAYGVLSTALIFAASQSRAVNIVQSVAFSISIAPPLGTFFLALWTKRTNALGVCVGMVVSVILVAWLSIGSTLYGNRHLPLPSPECPDNTTSLVTIVEQGILERFPSGNDLAHKGFFDTIYDGIPFQWYSLMSFLASFILGYLFSLCTSCLRKDREYAEDIAFDEPKNPLQVNDNCVRLLERSPENCKTTDEECKMNIQL